jgi:flagellar hook-associated protein 1 FlgK
MSTAMSGTTTDGAAVTVGGGAGYAVDISGMNNGDTISLTYTDNTTNTQHRMIFKRVDPSALPLSGTSVVGLDFSGGYSSVASQIQAALPSNVNVTASGSTLQVVDDGAGNQTDVNALSTTVNTAALAGGSPALPFFLDGTSAYTGSYTSSGAESVGLAGRISVNTALVTDPSNLVNYTSGLAASDATRANYIYDRLMSASHDYNPSAGIGTTTLPYSGTLGSFVRQFISQQGEAANNASSLKQGQDVVLSSLQQRFNDTSGVNIDQEMSHLLSLQNAYAANARVMTTVKTMLDQLMQMGA